MAVPLTEVAGGDPRLLRSLERFTSGSNCAQSVLLAYRSPAESDEAWELVYGLASALGGGLAGLGYTCGALAGAAMSLSRGLMLRGVADEERKRRVQALVREFGQRFGSPFCSGITGPFADEEAASEHCRFLLVGVIRMVDAALREVDEAAGS